MQTAGLRLRVVVVVGTMFLTFSSIQLAAQVTTINLTNRVLKQTHFFVKNNGDITVFADCFTANCKVTTPVFKSTIPCPGPLNSTCTYHIQMYGVVSVFPDQTGLYRFLINGSPPFGDQASLTDGSVYWSSPQPTAGDDSEVRSYAVVGTVKNRVSANQNHPVELDFGCSDTAGTGECLANLYSGELRVDVFVP